MKENNEKKLQDLSEEELKNVAGGMLGTSTNCKEAKSLFQAEDQCDDGYKLFDNGKCCK